MVTTAAVAIEWSAPGHVRVVEPGDTPLPADGIAPVLVEHKASRWRSIPSVGQTFSPLSPIGTTGRALPGPCRLQRPGSTGGHMQPRLAARAEQHTAGGSR